MADTTYIPLISSGLAGPLGVLHLPRLWQKVSLKGRGKLAEGYPDIGGGYDAMTLKALNLNEDEVRKLITVEKPTYPRFETWIKKQPGVRLDAITVYQHNASIRGYCHADEKRANMLRDCGMDPADKTVRPCAVDLNNLEDWHDFHKEVLR